MKNARLALSFGAVGWLWSISSASADFPDRNVTVLGRWTKSGVDFADVWGFATAGGREVAILLRTDGTSFIETTDPLNPVELKFIPGTHDSHRSCKTWQGYAYLVTEGSGGMQIVDIKDPDDIQLITTWGGHLWSHSHNVFIDVTAGLAFACGTDNGMVVVDVNDPLNPVHITNYSSYVHDGYAANGMAHLALISEGTYRILDISNLPALVELDSISTPARGCHTTWVDPLDTLCITCDEKGAQGHMAVYDITDPTNISLLSEFEAPTSASIHNAYPVGDTVHASWYQQGYVACNISEPTRPRYLGSKDFGDDRIWGVYPFQPSGTIYLSSIRYGLIVVRLDALIIDAEPHEDTFDQVGPYRILVHVFRTREVAPPESSVRLFHSFDGETFQGTLMRPTGNPNEYVGEIPAAAAPAIISYHIEAGSGIDHARFPAGQDHELHLRVGKVTTLYATDFEADDGWSHGADAGSDDWQRGLPLGESNDPGYAHSGQNVYGTELSGAYQPSSRRWLRSPTIDVAGQANVRLRYRRWLSVKPREEDRASILVNGNENFVNPSGVKHVDREWVEHDLDLSAHLSGQDTAQIEFLLETGATQTQGGWNADDLTVYALGPAGGSSPSWLLAIDAPQSLKRSDGGSIDAGPEDVVAFDPCTNAFDLFFDGSDVLPAGADIAGLHLEADGSLLLSFERSVRIPLLIDGPEGDLVRRADIVRFVPSNLGESTQGSFEFYFDGSDVGIGGNAIDGISRSGVRLILSLKTTQVIANVGTVVDADLISFRGLFFGSETSGSFDPYLWGSAVGLDEASEGIDAVALDPGSLLLSTRGDHHVHGFSGQDDDLLSLDRATNLFDVLVDGLLAGLDANDIDALAVIQ